MIPCQVCTSVQTDLSEWQGVAPTLAAIAPPTTYGFRACGVSEGYSLADAAGSDNGISGADICRRRDYPDERGTTRLPRGGHLMAKLLQTGLLAAVVLGTTGPSCRAVDPEAVNKAIDKGVKALRSMQAANGTWPHVEIGATALAGLTLLECGAEADDKAVRRAADAVRQVGVGLTHNYSIALSILFLDRLGDPADIPLIESLTVRLLAGQTVTGGWNYQSPAVSLAEVRRLQTKLAQRKELVARRELPKPASVKRTAKDLPKEIQQQLAILQHGGGGIRKSAAIIPTRSLPRWPCGSDAVTDCRSITP